MGGPLLLTRSVVRGQQAVRSPSPLRCRRRFYMLQDIILDVVATITLSGAHRTAAGTGSLTGQS
jgi:hypothetical protein